MDLLFRPAGALLDRVGFRAKFWLVGLIALAPLAYLTAQLSADLRAGVATAARERAGLAYVRALEPLMLAVQEHRGLVNAALAGNASAPARARRARLNADAAVRAVDGVAASHGVVLGVAGRWEPIKARWDALKEPADGRTAASSFHAHGALVAELLHFSEHLADASTLVLDPEAATYYLQYAVVRKLLPLTEVLAVLRGKTAGGLARGGLDADQRAELVMLAGRARAVGGSSRRPGPAWDRRPAHRGCPRGPGRSPGCGSRAPDRGDPGAQRLSR